MKIVSTIEENIDVSKLNEHLRFLANEGKKSAWPKNFKKHCSTCDKDVKNKSSLNCSSCKEIYHTACLSVNFTDTTELSIKNDFVCGNCQVYPDRYIEVETEEQSTQQLVDLKMSALLPNSTSALDVVPISSAVDSPPTVVSESSEGNCNTCNFVANNDEALDEHMSLEHITIVRNSSVKRGEKRNRSETSLVFD